MFYGLHTTTKAERDILLAREGEKITIDPATFQRPKGNKAIVIEEGTGNIYEHNPSEFFDVLREIEQNPNFDYHETAYMKRYLYKYHDVASRLGNLPALLDSIKTHGIQNPVHCEITGERLDGSYRTKIATYLGIKEVPAILHRFTWQDITEDFIERKLRARWLSSGKDYYLFNYGNTAWTNVPDAGPVYRENAHKAEFILPLITGKTVLDIGCNEGYISLMASREGHTVHGIDTDWNHIAWLNKLIYEFIDKKDIPVTFYEEDALETKRTADTILMLNVLYHFPKDKQADFLEKFHGKQIIFQCNLRKNEVRDQYYTSHPDDLMKLLSRMGRTATFIPWRDKPIIVSNA